MLKRSLKVFKHFAFRMMFNFYPPYIGAGISIPYISPDYTIFDVRMKLRFYNKNYFGTHFGGSLYSMCDPFFTIILIKTLGSDYIVWDKRASIQFKKPGRNTIHARFQISREKIHEVRHLADNNKKVEPVFSVDLRDDENNIIAHVEKTVYIRKKDRA
jgi:Domain of unknown function (DUF4442)